VTAVGAAASDRAAQEEDHSAVPAGAPWVVGGSKATCTPRKCRFPVTCDASVADPAYEIPLCGAIVSLYWRVGLLTETTVNFFDPDIPVNEQPQLPEAEGHSVYLGATTTLTLKTFKLPGITDIGRAAIKNALRKGKRTLPAVRTRFSGPSSSLATLITPSCSRLGLWRRSTSSGEGRASLRLP
jgi:hypothetical protein